MRKALRFQWAVWLVGAATLLALTACQSGEAEVVEVIKEVPVEKEVIKEVEVVREVVVEKEVVKEVPVEKVVVQEVEKVVVATAVPLGEQQFFMTTLDANPKYGGTLRIAAHGPPAHFDAFASITIANVGAQNLMYDQLVRRDARRTPQLPIIPDLAHRWEISSDGLTYTFFLREGVKFHDGSDFGAEDIKATYDRIIFPPADVASFRQGVLETVTKVDVVDAHTVAFTLGEFRSDAFMMQAFASGWNLIYKKEVLEENGGDMKQVDNPPGTGPVQVSRTHHRELDHRDETWTTGTRPPPTWTGSSRSGSGYTPRSRSQRSWAAWWTSTCSLPARRWKRSKRARICPT